MAVASVVIWKRLKDVLRRNHQKLVILTIHSSHDNVGKKGILVVRGSPQETQASLGDFDQCQKQASDAKNIE